jgi:hypothetical protein
MYKLSIKRLAAAAAMAAVLVLPAPALAAVNPDPASAAAAGIQYLAAHQQADGSISGFGGESEWSVEAVQAGGQQAAGFAHGGASLLDFVKNDAPGPTTSATTIERKIIAIAAAGQNPADFGGVNYLALLGAQHGSGQIGDPTLLNDDIFGLIAIDAAHASSLTPGAQDALDYLLAHQGADGGFSYTTTSCVYCGEDNNDTAAALIALYAAADIGLTHSGLDAARSAALTFLLGTQQTDGGFGYDQFSPSDGSSTSWSLMALNTLGGTVSSAAQARDWLLNNQNPDGGFSFAAYGTVDSDTSTTAHAVTALLGTTWLLRPAPLGIGILSAPAAGGSGGGTAATGSQAPTAPVSIVSTTTSPATTGADGPTDDASNGGQPDDAGTGPQVKGADTTRHDDSQKSASATSRSHAGLYAAGVLALVALIWFMLESRKPKGAGNEK